MYDDNELERTLALKEALLEKGLHSIEEFETMENSFDAWGPKNGAEVVAKSWIDENFRQQLLKDAKAATANYSAISPFDWDLVVLENTDTVHNVLVCSLCSCTYKPLIGQPPFWYKSLEYRARLVREPREVLSEMGLTLDPKVEIRVWDITAETGYLVIPQRPVGTEGWSEQELAGIVTKKSLIGAGLPDMSLVRGAAGSSR